LEVLFDREKGKAKLPGFLPNNYWSGTPITFNDMDYAWTVDFELGLVNFSAVSAYCRPIKIDSEGVVELKECTGRVYTYREAVRYVMELNYVKAS